MNQLLLITQGGIEVLEVAQQGPPGIDGETIVSAEIVVDQIVLHTNLNNTIVVQGSVRGPQGNPGIVVSPTAPANPQVNDLWVQIPNP